MSRYLKNQTKRNRALVYNTFDQEEVLILKIPLSNVLVTRTARRETCDAKYILSIQNFEVLREVRIYN